MSGRKKDLVWFHFAKIGQTAKCNYCQKSLSALVARMKGHLVKCQAYGTEQSGETANIDATSTGKSKPKQSTLETRSDGQLVATSPEYKRKLDEQVAKYFYATNTTFIRAEDGEFQKLCTMLRPGYKPPDEKALANELLNSTYSATLEDCQKSFKNQTVTMALDGWSNVHNEPIVGISIVNNEGRYALVDSIDTSGHPHDAEYLENLAKDAIQNCEELFGVRVGSFVTDNAANVSKMRRALDADDTLDVIQNGCGAHILELLSKDLRVKTVENQILKIIKYFRNVHLPSAWYKETGGKELVLPVSVRWNTISDSVESYLKNRGKLIQVCQDRKSQIEQEIYKLVNNNNLVHNAEKYSSRLKPISVALDRMQQDSTTIAVAVEIWNKLEKDLQDQPQDILRKFVERKNMALGIS